MTPSIFDTIVNLFFQIMFSLLPRVSLGENKVELVCSVYHHDIEFCFDSFGIKLILFYSPGLSPVIGPDLRSASLRSHPLQQVNCWILIKRDIYLFSLVTTPAPPNAPGCISLWHRFKQICLKNWINVNTINATTEIQV